jgi:hypothetical protein
VGVGNIKDKGKYRIGPWIHHLAWVASTDEVEARTVLLFGRIKGSGEPDIQCATLQITTGDADGMGTRVRELLTDLVELYLRGMDRPLPLFESASFKFAKRSLLRGKVCFRLADLPPPVANPDPGLLGHIRKALDNAAGAFVTADAANSRDSKDLDDPYVARVWADTDPLHDASTPHVPVDLGFARTALRVWQPLCESWTQEGKKPTIAPRDFTGGGAP